MIYGSMVYMGNAGFISSTVAERPKKLLCNPTGVLQPVHILLSVLSMHSPKTSQRARDFNFLSKLPRNHGFPESCQVDLKWFWDAQAAGGQRPFFTIMTDMSGARSHQTHPRRVPYLRGPGLHVHSASD